MKFTALDPQPPRRNPAMLFRDPIATENPGVFLPAPYDMVAPGLYPDELAVQLDTGELVAVSVWTTRLANGAGMEFRCWARLMQEDGQTMLDPGGKDIELETTFTATIPFIESRKTAAQTGEDRIARELMCLMLGEDPTTIEITGDPSVPPTAVAADEADWHANPHKAPPGTILSPEASEVPLVPWSIDVRLSNGIRQAIALAERATGEAGVDAGALLET